MKCKNPHCNDKTEGNKVYCSLKCRNVYVNKHLRDYSLNKKGIEKRSEQLRNEYHENPKKCKFCDKIITYDKRINDFCNSSCSASFNNKFKSGITYNISDEGLYNLQESAKRNFHGGNLRYNYLIENYKKNPKKCLNCNKELEYRHRKRKYCNRECRLEFENRNKTEYDIYKKKAQFKFNLSDYEGEFDFSLVEKYGWYKAKNMGDNLNGVSRDHMISIKEGFRLGIDSTLISHPANCELMVHNENVSKNDKCSITLEELKERIEYFGNKYNLVI